MQEGQHGCKIFNFFAGAEVDAVGQGIIIAAAVIVYYAFGTATDDQFVFEKVIGGIISVNFQQIRKLIVFAFPIMGRTAVKFNPVVEQTVAPAKKGGIIVGKRTEIQHKQ